MIYLDNAATSFPKPRDMTLAMEECITKYCGNPGRSGHYMSLKTGEGVYQARRKLAEFFCIENQERLVFTKNTTEALNIGIKGLLKPGDHVITTAMEHNSVIRPLREMVEMNCEITVITAANDGSIDVRKVERAIRPNTALIVMTAASNVTGTIMPVEEVGKLARSRGILFMLDGAQGAGTIDIDVKNQCIDLLAIPGHKGLLGPLGTGALYVSPHIEIEPIYTGGTGTESKNTRQPREFPEGYEAGTINAPAIIGLGKSLEFIEKVGRRVIGMYEDELINCLDSELKNMTFVELYGPCPSKKVGISLINIKGKDPEIVTNILSSQYGIAVRGGFHCAGLAHKSIGTWDTGAVRISVGPFNTHKDIQSLVDALWKIGKA